ncbi:hypothetical protein LWI28_004618 [Acer negundo]|uniref:Uncharacterized protein n=1 Tax=Acer negundo TaxID=4023 RepID=A0AAD5I8I2_ACENE|nr:hypothetical protein LWI28_004618 [Acer negundo]
MPTLAVGETEEGYEETRGVAGSITAGYMTEGEATKIIKSITASEMEARLLNVIAWSSLRSGLVVTEVWAAPKPSCKLDEPEALEPSRKLDKPAEQCLTNQRRRA